MTEEQALATFSKWYNDCLESGVEPEAVVAKMGGMALVTDEELVERLISEGSIPDYD